MALIAHYPLNGDTKDYSGYGNDGTAVGDTDFIMDGKIGEAVRFNKKSSYITSNHKHVDYTNNEHIVSFCMWVRLESFVGESWLAAQYSGAGNDRAILSIQPNGRVRYFIGGSSIHSNTVVPVSEWFHVGVIKHSDGLISIYLNGNADGGGLLQGKWGDTDTVFGNSHSREMPFELNDIRIYDHALSDKEVKEIAKAKVLHYKFDEHEGYTENVVSNTDLDTGWVKTYCTSIKWNDIAPPQGIISPVVSFFDINTDKSGYWYSYSNMTPQEPNTTYTISLYVRTNDSDFNIIAYTANNYEVGRYTSESRKVPNDGKWHRVVWDSFTNPSNSVSKSLSFRFSFGNNQGEGQRTWLCAPQMEEGTSATPFTSTSRHTTIKDSSGFGNDGTVAVATAPSWSEDSPVGRGSMEFSGSLITTGKLFYNSEQTHTVSAWVKPTNKGISNQELVNFHQGYKLFHTSNGKTLMYMNAGANDHYVYGNSLAENKWTQVTWVYDKSSLRCQVYYNGVLHASSTNFTAIDVPSGFKATTILGGNFVGNISDVRIYATALTPEDILELYQTRASVDNEGNLFVQEIDEISDTSKEVDSRGIARFNEFNEVDGGNKMSIKNDGVVYVNEIMEA